MRGLFPVLVCSKMSLVHDDNYYIENDYETVYNSCDNNAGTQRDYCEQPGTFYQTYGGGGGPGGWGGYWVREGENAVWMVEGSKFTYLDGKSLDVRTVRHSPDESRYICNTFHCKIVPRDYPHKKGMKITDFKLRHDF